MTAQEPSAVRGSTIPTAHRVKLVVGNWKMNKTSHEGARFIEQLASGLGAVFDREVLVAPPFTGLAEAVKAARGTRVAVAAQDVFWESHGPYTGAVSPSMLSDLGVEAVIIGHSERRQHFGETSETTGKKVRATLDHGLLAILCVGETEAQHAQGLAEPTLFDQIQTGLVSVYPFEAKKLVVAYEPVWAIGTGNAATPEIAQTTIAFVRECLSRTLGSDAAQSVRLLYGGSVSSSNIDELMAQPDIDGALVGGASLQVDSFARILAFASR